MIFSDYYGLDIIRNVQSSLIIFKKWESDYN